MALADAGLLAEQPGRRRASATSRACRPRARARPGGSGRTPCGSRGPPCPCAACAAAPCARGAGADRGRPRSPGWAGPPRRASARPRIPTRAASGPARGIGTGDRLLSREELEDDPDRVHGQLLREPGQPAAARPACGRQQQERSPRATSSGTAATATRQPSPTASERARPNNSASIPGATSAGLATPPAGAPRQRRRRRRPRRAPTSVRVGSGRRRSPAHPDRQRDGGLAAWSGPRPERRRLAVEGAGGVLEGLARRLVGLPRRRREAARDLAEVAGEVGQGESRSRHPRTVARSAQPAPRARMAAGGFPGSSRVGAATTSGRVMGLLDSLMGLFGGKGGSSQIMSVLGDLVESAGGPQGIMNKLEAAGLGDKLQSWIGTGENKPISGPRSSRPSGPTRSGRPPRRRASARRRRPTASPPPCPVSWTRSAPTASCRTWASSTRRSPD